MGVTSLQVPVDTLVDNSNEMLEMFRAVLTNPFNATEFMIGDQDMAVVEIDDGNTLGFPN